MLHLTSFILFPLFPFLKPRLHVDGFLIEAKAKQNIRRFLEEWEALHLNPPPRPPFRAETTENNNFLDGPLTFLYQTYNAAWSPFFGI